MEAYAGGNIMILFGYRNLERGAIQKMINFNTKGSETSALTQNNI